MNIKEVEEIKDLIAQAEIKKAKNQGMIEQIESDWKNNFGVETLEGAESKLEELEKEKEKSNNRLEKLSHELEESYNWEELSDELGM